MRDGFSIHIALAFLIDRYYTVKKPDTTKHMNALQGGKKDDR